MSPENSGPEPDARTSVPPYTQEVRRVRIVFLSDSLAKRRFEDSIREIRLIPSNEDGCRPGRLALGVAGQPSHAVIAIEFVERSVASRFAWRAHGFRTGGGATIPKAQLVVGRTIVRRRRARAQPHHECRRKSPPHGQLRAALVD